MYFDYYYYYYLMNNRKTTDETVPRTQRLYVGETYILRIGRCHMARSRERHF